MFYMAISGIFTFISGLLCALLVYSHRPRTPIKILWTLYALAMAIWGFGVFQLFTTTQYEVALFWGRFINLIAICIPFFFFHFVLLFTNRLESKKKELILYYVIFVAYFIIAATNVAYHIPDVSPKLNFLFYPDAGPLFYAFAFMFFYLFIYGLIILYKAYGQASSIRRNQYKYFLVSTLVGVSGGGTTFLLVFGVPLFPFGTIGVGLYTAMVAYTILKHNLLDINIVFRKSLVYTIFIGVSTVFYIVFVYLMEKMFRHLLGYQSIMGSMTAIAFIAIIFVPLRNYIQEFIDRRFFKASYLQVIEQNDVLRQQILRAERYKTMSTLSKRIIIEIRNPLTALIGYGDQLPRRLNDTEFMYRFIEVFNKEVGRIKELIEQLSQFSEPKSLDLKTVNLTALLTEVLDRIEEHLHNKSITIYKYFPFDRNIQVNADAFQLKQALYYFLVSAAKSISHSGHIWVGMEKTDIGVEISIKDTGRGLTKDELVNIFDPFFSSDEKDTYYGISIAQTIINNHGGKVIVDTEEGGGTEWIIQLPQLG